MNAAHTNKLHRQRGGAAVEFAILLIPMLVLLTGITEVGRAMYYYNTLAKSVRDAARFLSTRSPMDPDYAAVKTMAGCLAVHGNSTCSGSPLLPGLTAAMFSVCDPVTCADTHAAVTTGTGAINLVTATISHPDNPYLFESLAPFAPALFGIPSFAFGPISATMRQTI